MKKFLFLAFGAFVVLMVYMSNCGGCNDRPLVEKLERAILQRGWFGINAYICTAKLHKEHYINLFGWYRGNMYFCISKIDK